MFFWCTSVGAQAWTRASSLDCIDARTLSFLLVSILPAKFRHSFPFLQKTHLQLQQSMLSVLSQNLTHRSQADLAGVFVLSSFLADDTALVARVKALKDSGSRIPPMLQCHGLADPMIK